MTKILPGLVFLAGTALAQNPMPKVTPLPRTLSASQQFIIYENERLLRSRLARHAEDLKTQWLEAIRQDDSWHHPVIIYVHEEIRRKRPRVESRIYESDGGALKIQIDVNDRSILENIVRDRMSSASVDLDQEIFRALVLELIYRDVPLKAGGRFIRPPDWLVCALWEDYRTRLEGSASGLYEKLIARGTAPELASFLKQKPGLLDVTSRAIYRAESLALLRALLDLPGGGRKLAAYLAGLPRYGATDPRPLLNAFPDLNLDPRELSKRWVLNLARGSAADRVKPLRVEESDKELQDILNFIQPSDPKKPDSPPVTGPNAMPLASRAEGGKVVMREKSEQLFRLEMRSHPLYRPIVEEYRLIATELSRRPKKNMASRLTKAAQLRAAIVRHSDEISDYLNWFEAAKQSTSSGEFTEILEADSDFAMPGGRPDGISRYLEAVERRSR